MLPNYVVSSIFDFAALFRDANVENFNFHCGNLSNQACLADFIGQNRFRRLCERSDIPLGEQSLSRAQIKRLFINLLNVQADDEEADQLERFYSFTNYDELRALLLNEGPALEDLYVDRATTSGQGIQGQIEKAYILGLHHLAILNDNLDQLSGMLCDSEMLTSRLADREMQVGSVVHLSDGYFKVDRIFKGGGAYVSTLRNLNDLSQLKIVCRGTAMRKTATDGFLSGLNNLLIDIGSKSIKMIWPDLSDYLRNEQIDSIEVLGKSQGGAHAQMLAVLIEGTTGKHVKTLTTVSSVGVSNDVNKLWNSLESRGSEMNIVHIRNGGPTEDGIDYVPTVGGAQLGKNTPREKIKVYYIHPRSITTSAIYTATHSTFRCLKSFLMSFLKPHLLQMTLKPFAYTLVDSGSVSTQLLMGKRLESMRRVLAYMLHIITLGLLNGNSFESYYNSLLPRSECRAEG